MAAADKDPESGHDRGVQESANGDSGRALGQETEATSGQDAPKGLYRRLVAGPRQKHGALPKGLRYPPT